jgi:hypothetical protein
MLRIVTDSHIPPAVSKAARKLAPMQITRLRDWHGGIYLNDSDPRLLALAWEESVTLATYDVNTFPLWVKNRLEAGLSHAGMIYISARLRQNDVGGIARGLVRLWRAERHLDWTNRIRFLG